MSDQPPPRMCPLGHQLGPGRVVVGWSPCGCAVSIARPRGLHGHQTYLCLPCKSASRTTVRYDPPCTNA